VSDLDDQPLEPWPATTDEAEVWRYLQVERGVELWLEARRLGDLRRWAAEGVPLVVDVSDRIRLCFPIAESELETNPNLEPQQPDPVSPLYEGSCAGRTRAAGGGRPRRRPGGTGRRRGTP